MRPIAREIDDAARVAVELPAQIPLSGSNWYALAHLGACGEPRFLYSAQEQGSDTNAQALCPASTHPRGQDGSWVIGSGTGRTLSSLSNETNL